MRATNDAGRLLLQRDGQPDSISPFPERSTGELLAEELRRLDVDRTYAEALGTVTGIYGLNERSSQRVHIWKDPALADGDGRHDARCRARRTRRRRRRPSSSATTSPAGWSRPLVAAQAVRPLAFLAVTGGGILEQVMRGAGAAAEPRLDRLVARQPLVGRRTFRAGRFRRPQRQGRLLGAVRPGRARPGQHPPDAGRRRRCRRRCRPGGRGLRRRARRRGDRPARRIAATSRASTRSCSASGPDGHCASLFPEHPATHEADASVVGVHDSPKPPPTADLVHVSARSTRPMRCGSSLPAPARREAVAAGACSGADRARCRQPGPRVSTARFGSSIERRGVAAAETYSRRRRRRQSVGLRPRRGEPAA